MTSPIPVTGKTPAFGLEYLVEGEPAFHFRAKMERLAKATEAGLIARGAAAPGAADLTALAARVATLETDTGWTNFQMPAPVVTATARYRRIGKTVHLQVQGQYQGVYSDPFIAGTLQAGYRPTVTVPLVGFFWGGVGAFEFAVDNQGVLRLWGGGKTAGGFGVAGSFPVG